MSIKIGSTSITLPGFEKVLLGDISIWQKTTPPSGPVNYTITQESVLEHDTEIGLYNSICKIDDMHFVVAYESSNYDGWISTFSINESYEITEIDSIEHDSTGGAWCSLAMIDSTHFVLAYGQNVGKIKTFSIDENYDNITAIDEITYLGSQCTDHSLVVINSTHFILACANSTYDGYIRTFSIDENYDNITQIDSLCHDSDNGRDNSLIKIDDTHFMLAYAGSGLASKLKTFSIDVNYDITQIASLTVESTNIYSPRDHSLVMMDSTHFVLAFRSVGLDGFIATFSIDENYGNITQIDSLEHDTSDGSYNSLIKIDDTHFMLAYAGASSDGYIKTFSIDGSYDIAQIDSLEHDTTNGTYNAICQLDSTHYALAYAGAGDDGFVKIFELD